MVEIYYAVANDSSPVNLSVIRKHLKNLRIKWEEEIDDNELLFVFKKYNNTLIRFSVANDCSSFCTVDEYVNDSDDVQILSDIDRVLVFSGFRSEEI